MYVVNFKAASFVINTEVRAGESEKLSSAVTGWDSLTSNSQTLENFIN